MLLLVRVKTKLGVKNPHGPPCAAAAARGLQPALYDAGGAKDRRSRPRLALRTAQAWSAMPQRSRSHAAATLLALALALLTQPSASADTSGPKVKFTTRAREAFDDAGQHAIKHSQPEFGVFHLAFILFDARETRSVVDPSGGPSPLNRQGSMGAHVAGEAGADVLEISHKLERAAARSIEAVEPAPTSTSPTDELKASLLEADRIRVEEGKDTHVGLHHLLLSVAQHDGVAAVLKAAGLDAKLLRKTVASLRQTDPIDSADDENDKYDALLTYGIDLVESAQHGSLDPVIGREEEIRRVIQVLSRRTKNNPLLLGTYSEYS